MASSGAIETNAVGGLGSSPNRMRVEWSLASQNEDANQSTISWNVRGYGGASGYWTQNFQGRTWVDGALVQATGSFQMYQNSIFGSGNYTMGHDSAGNRSFGISADGRIYYNTVNSSGSGSWSLPGLYQEIAFNSITFSNITDVGFDVSVSVNRTANLLQLNIDGGGFVTYFSGNYSSKTVSVTGPLSSGDNHSVVVRTRRASNNNVTDSNQNVTTAVQNKFFDAIEF